MRLSARGTQRLTNQLRLALEPECLENPTATAREIPSDETNSIRDTQAACGFKCWASVAVGIPVAWYPRTDPYMRSLAHTALISDDWRRSVARDKDGSGAVREASVPQEHTFGPQRDGAFGCGRVVSVAKGGSPALEILLDCPCCPVPRGS